MKHEKTNEGLVSLIGFLRKYSHQEEAPIWRDIAMRLERPRRTWAVVNVSRLDRYAEANDTIVVPGSRLGAGERTKPITGAAWVWVQTAAVSMAPGWFRSTISREPGSSASAEASTILTGTPMSSPAARIRVAKIRSLTSTRTGRKGVGARIFD